MRIAARSTCRLSAVVGLCWGVHPVNVLTWWCFTGACIAPSAPNTWLELERLAPEFHARGVQVLAVSSDDETRGKDMSVKVNASGVRFAYGLSLASARQWGLYISASRGKTSIGIEEPALFSEPGVFLVRARWHAVLRSGSNHAVCQATVPRLAGCH